jgi:hypothetical protein
MKIGACSAKGKGLIQADFRAFMNEYLKSN